MPSLPSERKRRGRLTLGSASWPSCRRIRASECSPAPPVLDPGQLDEIIHRNATFFWYFEAQRKSRQGRGAQERGSHMRLCSGCPARADLLRYCRSARSLGNSPHSLCSAPTLGCVPSGVLVRHQNSSTRMERGDRSHIVRTSGLGNAAATTRLLAPTAYPIFGSRERIELLSPPSYRGRGHRGLLVLNIIDFQRYGIRPTPKNSNSTKPAS